MRTDVEPEKSRKSSFDGPFFDEQREKTWENVGYGVFMETPDIIHRFNEISELYQNQKSISIKNTWEAIYSNTFIG